MTKINSSDIFELHPPFSKTLNSHKGEMGVLLLKKVTCGPYPKVRAGCQEGQPCAWSPASHLWAGQGGWRYSQPTVNNLVSHTVQWSLQKPQENSFFGPFQGASTLGEPELLPHATKLGPKLHEDRSSWFRTSLCVSLHLVVDSHPLIS